MMKRKQQDTVENPAKKSKLSDGTAQNAAGGKASSDHLYRAPTGEEMTTFKEAEGLYRSNLFRLQISELLSEVATKQRHGSLDKALAAVKQHLETLPNVDSFKLCDESSWLPAGVQFPVAKDLLGQCTKDATFSFAAPSSITVVGSYLLGTLAKPELNVDLAVEIPAGLLDDGDHLNHRYTHKRAAYLCYLAHHLSQCSAVAKVEFMHLQSRLMPIINLTLAGKVGQRFSVRVHPVVGDAAFKLVRLGPTRNCLRWKKFYGLAGQSDDPSTAYYNSLLLRDMSLCRHLALLHSAFQQCPAMADAMRLVKVWLRQRSLDKGMRCFNGFMASMLAAHLVQTRQVSKTMSSYQIVRMLLKTLATVDWTKRGTFMHKDDSTPTSADFHSVFEVVFVDDTGYLNLAAHMSESSYRELVHEARLAIECLDASSEDAFNCLFMTSVHFAHKFDHVIQVSSVSGMNRTDAKAWQERCLAAGGDWLSAAERYTGRVLRRGLGDRAPLISIKCNGKSTWSVSKSAAQMQRCTMTIGLLLDHTAAYTVVEQGPSADAPEAEDFRAFWGKKSELRRFQDSSILEAVVWQSNSVAEKRTIPTRIISHLLERHMHVPTTSVMDYTCLYDSVLRPVPIVKAQSVDVPSASAGEDGDADEEVIAKNSQQAKALLAMEKAAAEKTRKKPKMAFVGTGEEETGKILSTFEFLARHLRSMEGLSLDIVSVQGACSLFRHTELFPAPAGLRCKGAKSLSVAAAPGMKTANWRSGVLLPAALRCPPWTDVYDVVCHLEGGSASWPDDVDAIARVKASFYLQLSAMLEQKHSITAVPTPQYLYISVNGFVFRMSIAHAYELTLLERKTEETQSIGMATPETTTATTAAANAVATTPRYTELQRHTVALPLHTGHMHSVGQQFPAFSMACRLAKRWVACQLLSRYFNDETVELLVARVFVHPGAFKPPGCGVSGLLRFLSLLVNFNWSGQPLIVNIASELNNESLDQLAASFQSRREHLPSMVIFTPSDHNSCWTTHKPPPPLVLRRAQMLAQQAIGVLEGQIGVPAPSLDQQICFRPSYDDYHVLIHLRVHQLPHRYQSLSAAQALEVDADDMGSGGPVLQLPVAGFDPVNLYLDQLEAAYGHVALFFYDRYGGRTIGVVWTGKSAEQLTFKISTANGFTPVPSNTPKKGKKSKQTDPGMVKDAVVFNKDAALDDFRILGSGLVKRVEILGE